MFYTAKLSLTHHMAIPSNITYIFKQSTNILVNTQTCLTLSSFSYTAQSDKLPTGLGTHFSNQNSLQKLGHK